MHDIHKRFGQNEVLKGVSLEARAGDVISLIGSSVLTEEVFARPGLGKLMIGATKQRDYTLLQAIMVVYALIIVAINILVDVIYTTIDPRVRRS